MIRHVITTYLPFHASVDAALEIRIVIGSHAGHLIGVVVVIAVVCLQVASAADIRREQMVSRR